jgi:energy-coupling factor transporter ATP-binding protein EcfA2
MTTATTPPAYGEPVPRADPAWPGRLAGWPTFARELAGTLAARAQYVLHGNIRDLYLIPPPGAEALSQPGPERERTAGRPEPVPLPELLWRALQPSGFQCLIRFDRVHGISVYPSGEQAAAAAERLLGPGVAGTIPSLPALRRHLAAVAGTAPPAVDGTAGAAAQDVAAAGPGRPRAAFVIDYAARIPVSPVNLTPEERDFFLFCLKLADTAERCGGGPPARPGHLFNPLIWLVEGERDLPAWLTAGSERIRVIGIPDPDLETRQVMARLLAQDLAHEPADKALRAVARFAEQSGGLSLAAMREVTRLVLERRMPAESLPDALRLYKLGVEDNPWRRQYIRERILAGEPQLTAGRPAADGDLVRISSRVFGQDQAVGKAFDILKRAALGLSGAQASSSKTRPRGVMFFAGPTGVGKTELAKAAAELLFGQTDSFLRFDMSEFAAEHADHRLVGAPPGYVGFEAGGELTSAVRRQPFRVILFDEIEKAHRRVLDKFLQILDEGRLTDGQGVTTYFSECVLIFTSNLGIMVPDPEDREKKIPIVSRGEKYEEIEKRVKAAIAEHFTNEIGRPELLNRFGDNIVVFGFISDAAAEMIFAQQIASITRRLDEEQQVRLVLTGEAWTALSGICTEDTGNGGRGIGNLLESALINPLSRVLFARELRPGSTATVLGVHQEAGVVSLTVDVDGWVTSS